MTAHGGAQNWDPERYARNARFVADLGQPVVDLLAPVAGERIIDLGCGDGHLTRRLADLGIRVVGLDAASEQVEAACRLGLDARVADAARLDAVPDLGDDYDAVFSNACLHWVRDADAAIDGVWKRLRPGGRFVGEMGGFLNVAALSTALVAALNRRGLDGASARPWYFPTAEAYRARLEGRGFVVTTCSIIPRPTRLPGDVSGWLATFAESFLSRVPETERAALVEEVRASVAPQLRDADGTWYADYVRLRFRAERPACGAV